MTKNKLLAAVAVVNTLIIDSSFAQEEDNIVLEEVIVTATRRSTSLIDTPLSVTSLDNESLRVLNIENASNLQNAVPGLQIRDNSIDGQGSVDINLRGVGNSNYIETGESNVSFNIDGVYTARPQAMLQLFNDVERVEISRGPQGTLSGRNATAGSINVIPNKPNFESIIGQLELEATSFNGSGVGGLINIPFGETFAMRANFTTLQRDSAYLLIRDETNSVGNQGGEFANVPILNENNNEGINEPYFENRYGAPDDDGPGSHGSKDYLAYRISGLWEPSDGFNWLLSYEGYQNNALGAPLSVDCERADCEVFYSPNQVRQVNTDPFTSFITFKGEMDQHIDNLRSVINWDINSLFSVRYTFGRSEMEQTTIQDVDGGAAIELVFVDDPWLNESTVHDLQINSNSGDKLDWVVGLFSFEETTDRRLAVSFFTPGWDVFDSPDYNVSTQAIYADINYSISDSLNVFGGLRQSHDEKSNEGASRYSLSSLDCANAVAASPLNEAQGGVFLHAGVDALIQEECLVANNETRASSDDFTDFRFGLAYDISEDSNIYFSISSGHKARLQDQAILIDRFSPERLIIPTETEELINYEIGAKGTLFDKRVQFASALFFIDYKNKQEALTYNFGDRACDLNGNGILDGPPAEEGSLGCGLISGEEFDLSNPTDLDDVQFPDQVEYAVVVAPEIDIYGAEFEAIIGMGDGNLSGFLTFTQAEYGEFNYSNVIGCPNQNLDNATGGWCSLHDVSGNTPRSTPEVTLNLSYTHIFTLANSSTIIPTFNAYYRSEYFLQPENSEGVDPSLITQARFSDNTFFNDNESELYADIQDASVKVNFNITWSSPSEVFQLELYGTNIFDEVVRSHMRVDTGNTPLFVYEEPAVYGMRFRYNYDRLY